MRGGMPTPNPKSTIPCQPSGTGGGVVKDAILQDNEKMKVEYLRSLLFDLFETLQAVRPWQRNSASFQILLLWQPKSKLLSIIEKTKGPLFNQK